MRLYSFTIFLYLFYYSQFPLVLSSWVKFIKWNYKVQINHLHIKESSKNFGHEKKNNNKYHVYTLWHDSYDWENKKNRFFFLKCESRHQMKKQFT